MQTTEIDKYKDRTFNIRPLCLWAFLVGVTIVMCLWSLWAVAVWMLFLVIAFVAIQFLKTRDAVLKFFGTSRLFFIGALVICLAAILSFGITTLSYTHQKSFGGTNILTGTVEKHRFLHVNEGVSYFILSGAKYDDKKISGRVIVFITEFQGEGKTPVTGTQVSLETRINRAEANDMNINSRVKYSANISFENIDITGKNRGLRHSILRYSKTFFEKYLSPVNGGLMYSMLFGDKSELDGELRDDFAIAGLAHVLAVSGMHVVIIIGMLIAFLKLCRVRQKYRFPIILVALFFYCYLCGFVYPILRASMMFMILMANKIYLRKTDLLSSICAAAIVTLIIFPYAILSVSFQLSYACMLGIALFMHPTTKLLQKTIHPKTPRLLRAIQNFFIKGTAMYVCVTLITLPIVIKFFGYIPVYGIVANLFILPVLVLCFQVVVLSLVTWIAFPLLYPINYLIDFVRWGTKALAGAPGAVIHATNSGYWFIFFIIGIILCTRFIFMPKVYKYSAATFFMVLYCIGFLV